MSDKTRKLTMDQLKENTVLCKLHYSEVTKWKLTIKLQLRPTS